MPVTHIRIENYKSIKRCDIDLKNLTSLIGANGTGKTNILDAIIYFYNNLTESKSDENVYDINNRFSNQIKITLTFDLSNFVMISKKKTNADFDVFSEQSEKLKYQDYFKAIISLVTAQKEPTISLQLSQVKGRGIQWSEAYEKRVIIKSLFPFFYIDTRNLDINEWSKVWSILGELAKVSNQERVRLERQVSDIVEENSETKGKIRAIRSIFESSELSVLPSATKDYASMLAKLYFSGEKINQKGKKLQYYSTGTNSVKYIEVLLRAINEIARNKMKEPVVLIDEPEISLHPSFIDELSEVLMLIDQKLRVVLSTHSARLIKKMMPFENLALYNVKLCNNYTVSDQMRRYQQYSPSSKYRVLDDYINSYFSKGILFVEGETELELFSNPYLQILFSKLKCFDVYQAMSQEPILNIMNPGKTKSNIPYICLIDMDKTIQFNGSIDRFELKNEYFKNEKERFRFRRKGEKQEYLHHLHSRINAMTEKLKVHYFKPYFSCNDPHYKALIKAIHDYLLQYSVFTFKTTIEGSLINEHNIQYALEFLEKSKKTDDFHLFMKYFSSCMKTDQMNIVRLLFNGKTDLLKNYGGNTGIKKCLTSDQFLILDKMMIGKKTSGWVSDYIDQFFWTLLPEKIEKSPKGMKRLFEEKPEMKNEFVKEFSWNFPELFDLFSKMYDIIN